MWFNEKHKVIIGTLNKEEAKAFVKFLESEIIRHQDEIELVGHLKRYIEGLWGIE